MFALNNPAINNIKTITNNQIDTIKKIPVYLQQVDSRQPNINQEMIDLRVNLDKLQKSISSYRPSICQWFKDLFTGRLFKILVLKRHLPRAIKSTQQVAEKILKNCPNYRKSLRSILSHKIKLINAALKYNTITNQALISQKVNNCRHRIGIYTSFNPAETAELANRYLRNVKRKLRKGIDVPLPSWYHATKTFSSLESIIKGKTLIQGTSSYLVAGPGVYISTNDERYYGSGTYGSYTFAIDHDCIEKVKATYFRGLGSNNPYPPIWVAVKEDIPVNPQNIAYLVVKKDELSSVKSQQQRLNSGLKVKSLETNEWIHYVLEVSRKRLLPDIWNKNSLLNREKQWPTNLQ